MAKFSKPAANIYQTIRPLYCTLVATGLCATKISTNPAKYIVDPVIIAIFAAIRLFILWNSYKSFFERDDSEHEFMTSGLQMIFYYGFKGSFAFSVAVVCGVAIFNLFGHKYLQKILFEINKIDIELHQCFKVKINFQRHRRVIKYALTLILGLIALLTTVLANIIEFDFGEITVRVISLRLFKVFCIFNTIMQYIEYVLALLCTATRYKAINEALRY